MLPLILKMTENLALADEYKALSRSNMAMMDESGLILLVIGQLLYLFFYLVI